MNILFSYKAMLKLNLLLFHLTAYANFFLVHSLDMDG